MKVSCSELSWGKFKILSWQMKTGARSLKALWVWIWSKLKWMWVRALYSRAMLLTCPHYRRNKGQSCSCACDAGCLGAALEKLAHGFMLYRPMFSNFSCYFYCGPISSPLPFFISVLWKFFKDLFHFHKLINLISPLILFHLFSLTF